MGRSLRVLVVDDNPTDAELALRELARAGLKCEARRVDTEPAFRGALAECTPEVILCDYSMPQFSGTRALSIARRHAPQVPFIFVSGTLGEEHAIGALRDGATDYVLKDNLARLPSVVERALQEAAAREERRRMQRALHESEAGLRRAQLMAGLAHVITDRDGEFESWSASLPRLIGRDGERMPRSTRAWLALVHPQDQAAFRADCIEAGRRLARTEVEYRLLRPDGGWIHLRQVLEPMADSLNDGGRMRWFSTIQDISAQREAARALETSEERYRATFEQAAVGIVHSALDGGVLMVNRRICEMSGYQRTDLLQMNLRELIHPDDAETSVQARARMAAGADGYYHRELRHRRKDGSYVWCDVTTSLVSEGGSGPRHFVSVLADITERRRAEDELRRFRLALDNSPDIVLIIDRASMRHVDANDTACRLLGYTREELLAMGPADLLPVTREELERAYDALIVSGRPSGSMNSYYRCKDGSQLPFESTRRVLRSGDRWLVVAVSRDIRERLAAEAARREAEAQFRSIFENSADGIYQMAPDGRVTACNPAAARMFGYGSPDEVLETVIDRASQPFVDREVQALLRSRLNADGVVHGFELRLYRRDQSIFWASLSARMMRDDRGEPSYVLGVIQDISERKAQQEKIERLSRVHAMLSGINAAIVRVHDRDELFREACRVACAAGRFRMAWAGVVDREAGRVRPLAWRGVDEGYIGSMPLDLDEAAGGRPSLAGQAVRERRPVVADDMAADPRVVLRSEAADRGFRALAILPLLDGDEAIGVLALYAAEAAFFDAEEIALLAELAGDVSFALGAIAREEKLNYLAMYDPLTGLANRALLLDRLGQSLRAAGQGGGKLALAWFDIERITGVNESLGRAAGDLLLKQAGGRLAAAAGAENVARVAADHFAVVLPDVKGRSQAARAAAKVAQAAFGEPFLLAGADLRVTAKAGLSLFPNDGAEAETLLGNAEAALKRAKQTGERQVFYTADLTERTGATLSLENKLRRALEKEEFVLHYQPKLSLAGNAILGAEALIRWQSPELGLVPPGRFIPLLEKTGLILEVGAWALRRAALDHRRWVEQRLPAPRIAVNVSAIQLRQRDFIAALVAAVGGGAAPAGIDLEITESLVMDDVEDNIEKLKAARALGMEIAIDDFGTGYSSLGYLAKLPVNALKIDRSFIITMLKEPDTMALVQTFITLAHSLRLKVVAEGVDDPEQAKVLRLVRCDQFQGYLFSKPLPFEQMSALLAPQTAAAD